MRTKPNPDTLLGGLTIEAFLENYWQKRPLLIRGAYPGYESPIAAEDLMRLSCDPDAEARLILERDGDYPWQLLYGPFEEDFSDMPESHWTLLVQEVDRHIPAIANLLNGFRFLPSWRIDDIMVSFAKKDGGVGAHVDNYDVFLLQGMGQRRWQIMNQPVAEEVLVPDLDIRMLQHFTPDEDWVLAPGDMLYLPPRVAHKGIALDDCMTFSIGFRAPSHADILTGFLGFASENIDENLRYGDPDLQLTDHPTHIDPQARKQVQRILQKAVSNREMIEEWFGRYLTEPKRDRFAYPLEEPVNQTAVRAHLSAGHELARSRDAIFAFMHDDDRDIQLFAGGSAYTLPPAVADGVALLCEASRLSEQTLAAHLRNETFVDVLVELVNEGYLEFVADPEGNPAT